MDTVNLLSSQEEMYDDMYQDGNGLSMQSLDLQGNSEECSAIIPGSKKATMTRHLLLATLMAALGGVLFGYDIGIVAGAMLQLRVEFSLSALQQEIVVSTMLMGAVIGSLFGGFIIDAFGRRHALIFNSVVFTVGGLILTCATSFMALNIGRLILGFAVSLSAIGECIYISEVSPSNLRGQLVSLNELGITIGILLAYLVSYFFIRAENGWRFMFGISIIPAIIQGCGMVILPSSPRFLVKRGKIDEAVLVLQKLRSEEDVSDEVNGIKAGLAIEDGYSVADLFKPKANMRMRMLIGGGLVFLQQATGQTNVVYYAPIILQQIGFESNLAAASATVGIGVTKFLSTALCLLIVDHIGRRKLLLLGVTCMMLSIVLLGITTEVSLNHLQNLNSMDITMNPSVSANLSDIVRRSSRSGALYFNEDQNSNTTEGTVEYEASAAVKAVSLISLMVFVAAYAFSFGPVTWLLLSEIYPLGIRGRATSLVTSLNWATNMVLSLTFLDLINAIGIGALFISYGVICLMAILFVYFMVPETKNRTLEDISKDLSERKFAHSRRRVATPMPFRVRHLQLPVSEASYSAMPSQEC